MTRPAGRICGVSAPCPAVARRAWTEFVPAAVSELINGARGRPEFVQPGERRRTPERITPQIRPAGLVHFLRRPTRCDMYRGTVCTWRLPALRRAASRGRECRVRVIYAKDTASPRWSRLDPPRRRRPGARGAVQPRGGIRTWALPVACSARGRWSPRPGRAVVRSFQALDPQLGHATAAWLWAFSRAGPGVRSPPQALALFEALLRRR